MSWNDADGFIRQLNEKLPGFNAALPSEAQWEYACRAGTTTPFSFGETITPEQVNYDGNFPYREDDPSGENREKTVPVKSMPRNAWGLYEMHGNVWEWCADWYGPYPVGAVNDPEGPPSGDVRVLRGGSWVRGAWNCRSAGRYWYRPGFAVNNIGFRLSPGH